MGHERQAPPLRSPAVHHKQLSPKMIQKPHSEFSWLYIMCFTSDQCPCSGKSQKWLPRKIFNWASSNSYVCANLLQSCLTLCDTKDYRPPGPSVHGFSRQEYWTGLPSSRGCSQPRDWTRVPCSSCVAGRFLTAEPPRKPNFSYSVYFKNTEMYNQTILKYVVIDYLSWFWGKLQILSMPRTRWFKCYF